MKDRTRKGIKRSARAVVRRRNPVAKALIERALGERPIPGAKRYTRKAKHARRIDPERE